MMDGESSDCGCTGDLERAEQDTRYRTALWWVVALNVGFGLTEIAGGFLANSQALKADALDFLGDGSITFIGLLALGWSSARRAPVALVQGGFLMLLGIGVIVMAAWRALNAIPPEAELMGAIGIAALAVNVTAALILARFRKIGDAQARAIWLFSRNDALANVAVIIAAVCVYWLDNAWPDLIVAAAIAALFIHSASEIIRDARGDLRESAKR